jgi:MinD-like ATPase involved in chromosome partitioning or flagellar assembly
MAWGATNESNQDAVTLLLAGSPNRLSVWSQAFQMDSRFRVVTLATDPQDLQAKLSYNPEVILLDAAIFSGPEPLTQFLTRVQGAAYVVLPAGVPEEITRPIREMTSVKGVFIGDVNIPDLSARIMAEIGALRAQAPALAGKPSWQQTATTIGGLRVITVWNRAGGTGKSTVATALALDAAQRGFKTLLVGLSAPDVSLPTFLNLKTTPNLSLWLSRPTLADGVQPAIQSFGGLDVLVGLQDSLREKDLLQKPEEQSSINSLAIAATYGGYAVIVFDTPVSGCYPSAISASNTLVLVSNPTIDHAVITAEAYRVVFQKLAGQHRVGASNAFIVLNRSRNGLLGMNEWHEAARAFAQSAGVQGFPPVTAVIPEIPEVAVTANAGRSVLTASENFARPIHKLGDLLFGQKTSDNGFRSDAGVVKLGPIRIRKG